jgi:tetratricopeptide (TPR) repeat protein
MCLFVCGLILCLSTREYVKKFFFEDTSRNLLSLECRIFYEINLLKSRIFNEVNLLKSKIKRKQIEYLMKRGNKHLDQDNDDKARRYFEKIVEINPNYGHVWTKLGITSYKKNPIEAFTFFQTAIEIDPNDYVARYYIGAIYFNQKDNKNALLSYRKAIEINPDWLSECHTGIIDACENLSLVSNDQKDYQEIIFWYKKLIEYNPEDDETKKKLLDIYEILGIEPPDTEIEIRKENNNDINSNYSNNYDGNNEIKILREFEFIHGQVRFKIAFVNKSDTVITDLETYFKIPEALKWIGHEPDFKRKGDSVIIPKLNPEEKKVISLYLEPINCMEGDIRATLSYSDARNQLHTAIMKDKTINITCPIFFTTEDANPARVKSLHRSLTNKDRKILPLPSGNLTEIFALIQSAIGSHDIKLISKEFSLEEKIGELMYYGVTKVKQNSMVIKALLDGNQLVIELEVAGNSEDSITSLLAEIQNQLRTSFNEKGLIKNKNVFMEMKTSVILRICPHCGSEIKAEDQIKYKKGADIFCEWCKHFIMNY